MRASARSASRSTPPSRPRRDVLSGVLDHQDHRRVHGDHGRRGAADPGGAAHLRLDAGPPGTEPRGAPGTVPAGRGRAQESAQRRDAAGAVHLVRVPAVARVLHLHRRGVRRDEPAAVRPAGSRGRADRRVPHRIQRHEVLDVLHRGVLEHGDRVGPHDHAVLRRVGHPVHDVGQYASLDGAEDRGDAGGVLPEGELLPVPVHLGAVDAATLPLRPADGAGVEGDAAARPRVPDGHRYGAVDPARRARLDLRHALRARAVRFERPARDPAVLRARSRPHRRRLDGRGAGLMAIGLKVMKRPGTQVSYLRATLKGMALTFSHLWRPKVTMQYPEEKSSKDWTLSPRWRGTHRMLTDEQGRAKCVACGLCPQICPANCIKLVPGGDEHGNRYPLIYEIDEFRCVFCGYCQEVCPEEAIHVGVHYENAEYSRDRFVYDLERLCAQTHPVSTLWDPSDPKGE